MPMERDGTRERPSYVKQSSLVLIYVCFWYFLNLQLHIIIFWFLWSPQLFPIEITFQCPLLASLQIAKALPNGIRPGSPGPGRGHETEPTRCSWASPKFTNGSPYFLRSGMGGKWCMGLCWLRWILFTWGGAKKLVSPQNGSHTFQRCFPRMLLHQPPKGSRTNGHCFERKYRQLTDSVHLQLYKNQRINMFWKKK